MCENVNEIPQKILESICRPDDNDGKKDSVDI